MARPVHALLRPPLLAVVCLLLFQGSKCCRPPSSPSSSPGNDHVDAPALHRQLLLDAAEVRTAGPPTSTEVAGDGRTGAAAAAVAAPLSASATTTTPARAVGAAVASSRPRQTSDRALLVRPGMLLRSKLARRFLAAGAGVDDAASATDGAAASCRSNNPHMNCPPASKP